MGVYQGHRAHRDVVTRKRGSRWDHGRIRHHDYLVPLRKKRRHMSVDRRDHGTGNPGSRRDHGKWVSRKLPCGGAVYTFRGVRKPKVNPGRKGRYFITDKRHFAGVKAADTKLRHQAKALVGRVQRNILLERWEPASKWMLRLAQWIDKQFGWDKDGRLP